jgi:hypothetical protein
MLIWTPLGQVTPRIAALSQAIAFFLVLLLLHGSLRNKLLSLALVPKQNFEHWLLPLQRLYGFDGYSLILVSLVMHPHLYCVITLEPHKELTKHIGVDAFFTRSNYLSCNWPIFSLKPKLESNIGFI